VRFRRPRRILAALSAGDVPALLREMECRVRTDRLYAAGFLSYEASAGLDPACETHPAGDFPCAWFGLYGAPEACDPPPPRGGGAAPDWAPDISPAAYRRAIADIRNRIRNGETYQVNFTYRLRAAFDGFAEDLFARLIHAQGPCYGAYVDLGDWAVCSASPELFFTLEDGLVITRPMKGTAARESDRALDEQRRRGLETSEKERAENLMIVDMVRNDLGRIARTGSVEVFRLFDCRAHPTVWQMTSTVGCRTERGPGGILAALFPAASITGAPKVQTMRILRGIESSPRRIYTGTVGFAAPDGRAQFNVAIRTALVDRVRRSAEYGTGGGITWDSSADAEWEEARTKTAVLSIAPRAFELLETLRWSPGEGFALLDAHLDRAARSAAYFRFSFDRDAVLGALRAGAAGRTAPHRVRLLLRGDGRPAVEFVRLEPRAGAYRVRFADRPVSSADPFLFHKTTRRDVYESAQRAAGPFDDVLLWNERGEVTESCIANFIVERAGCRFTPPRSCGLLAGAERAERIRTGWVTERILRLEDLRAEDRFYLANSVRGVWEIDLDFDTRPTIGPCLETDTLYTAP
jgi:para-aminobenzoate synthetase / 4-amino-4-deoxychorismate lyase